MSRVNTQNAKAYSLALQKFGRRFRRDLIAPFVRDVVKEVLLEAARLTPYNLGTLRSLWMVTMNGSGRLSESADFDDLAKMVDRNMSGYNLRQTIAIENDTPYAEIYEYGLYRPASPAYAEIGGSLALHVPISRRSEKRGKVLIVQGYNVTAPFGMVSAALEFINAQLSVGAFGTSLSKVVTV